MEQPRHSLAAAACVLGIGAVGCTAPVGEATDAGSTQRLALVEVKAMHAAADGALLRLDASARFVAVREPGLPSDALDLLGLAWQTVPSGTCAAVDESARPSQIFRVDLRDVSPVSLEVRGEEGTSTPIALEPRAFPDVVGLVSGVVFVAPSLPFSSAKSVSVGAGGVALGGFDLPDAPRLDLVGAVAEGGAFSIASARGVDLVDASPRSDDRVAVDVLRAGVLKARCVLGERQGATSRLHLDGVSLGGPGDATLLVRAQRRVLRDTESGPIEARLERDVEVRIVLK